MLKIVIVLSTTPGLELVEKTEDVILEGGEDGKVITIDLEIQDNPGLKLRDPLTSAPGTMAGTHTVIVGSGIVGISTAYYLSLLSSEENSEISAGRAHYTSQGHHIHLVDPAPTLFEHAASGKAGGFLARNWFSSSVAELGAFSFDLHKSLAEEFDGRKKWGWSQSTVINLDITGSRKKGSETGLGEGWDWIQSRDSMVPSAEAEAEELAEYPPWLNEFAGVRPLADRESTAQM
jgi:glycine/D-amino acid oxidase-like deaminating enzyme